MSLSYSTRSVIGGKFDSEVEKQLELRKSVVTKVNTRTVDDIKYLNSTTGWVRVISSVDTRQDGERGYNSEAARKYILQGGIPDSFSGFNPTQNSTSYTKSTEYGYVPTAGITSFQLKSKGTFGTLRTASFTFTVNSPEDFSQLEQLYLRPGFSILLEWGHSYFLSNSTGKLGPTVDIYPIEDFLKTSSDTAIETKIDSLKKTSNSYNYDAIFGIIKNFIWNYNGYTYECQVDIVSKGEVVESVKTSMAPLTMLKQDPEAANAQYEATQYGSELLAFLEIITSARTQTFGLNDGNFILEDLKKQNKTLTDRLTQTHTDVGNPLKFLSTKIPFNTNTYKYITLRTLLVVINECNLLYNKQEPLTPFNVGEYGVVNTFTTFEEHFALDPRICLLPNTVKTSKIFTSNADKILSNSNDILNILIGVDYLRDTLKEIEEESDKDSTIYDFILDKVMLNIQDNLGNVNYFDIHQDYKEGRLYSYIVDRKVIPSRNDIKTKLDLVGLSSEVSNLNITSKLSNNLSSMIAIAAQTNYSPSSAEDLYNLQKWNVGLKDRHLDNITTGRQGTITDNIDTDKVVSKDLRDKLQEYIDRVNEQLREFTVSYPDIKGLGPTHKQVMNEYIRAKTNTGSRTNPPGLIPFELSFTIRGISGIKVGQAFTINDFFLPERYKGRVGFIVTGIDHTVSDNRWTTDLRSQMIFL